MDIRIITPRFTLYGRHFARQNSSNSHLQTFPKQSSNRKPHARQSIRLFIDKRFHLGPNEVPCQLPQSPFVRNSTMLKGQNSLMTIPIHDEDTFLLVQLPDSLPIEALLKTAALVGHKPKSQACLVTDDKSFALSRVETSNALILVPERDATEPSPKKQKTSKGTELIHTQCRLLGAGSGAYFLELKETFINLKDLEGLLNTFDPYDVDKNFQGVSLDQLALQLQLSKAQVQNGLKDLLALQYQDKYSLLSEEAWQEARRAILSALTECDAFANFAHDGLNRHDIIRESMERVTEKYPQLEEALRLVISSMTKKEEGNTIYIDFDKVRQRCNSFFSTQPVYLYPLVKVATFVAHELFSTTILSHEKLSKEWQARVPGVGDAYQLDIEKLLRGVAIRINDKEWQYLPAEKLGKSPIDRLGQLFEAREKWTKQELEPYLKPLWSAVDDLLIKHCHSISEQVNGETITMYVKK
jgi:Sister chromatid cohesion protein Dcc1